MERGRGKNKQLSVLLMQYHFICALIRFSNQYLRNFKTNIEKALSLNYFKIKILFFFENR